MKKVDFIALAVLLYCVSCGSSAQKSAPAEITSGIQYKCMPCGYDCDTVVYSQSGICSHCNMQLVNKETITHKTISPADICGLNAKELIFLDVRTAAEFNGTAAEKFGAIKNAINMPVQELESRIAELER
jgi:hypothetical protein